MGIFSSKKRTYTSASFYPLMSEKDLPDTIRSSVLNSVLRHQGITNNLLNDIINGPPVLLQRFYKRAASGKYPYGLPGSILMSRSNIEASFHSWLTSHVGPGVAIEYAKYMPYHERHNVWKKLTEDYDYDETTNIVGTSPQPSYTTYINDIIVVLDGSVEDSGDVNDPNEFIPLDPEMYEAWETAAKDRTHPWRASYPGDPVQSSYDPLGNTGAHVEFIWSTNGTLANVSTLTEFIATPEGDPDDEYFQAKYYFNDGSGTKAYYFTYDGKSGTYPALDALVALDNVNEIGQFMPYLHLRSQYDDLADISVQGTETFKQTKKMFDLIGIDMLAMADQLNENPNIGNIVQASVGFHFKLNTSSALGRKYIFHFFKWLYDMGLTGSSDRKSVSTQDELLNINLRFRNIIYTGIIPGVLAPLGEYLVNPTSVTVTETVYFGGNQTPQEVDIVKWGFGVRHQITSTEYEEYFVEDPSMLFGVPGKNVIGTLEKFSDSDFNLLVPVSRTVVEQAFTFREREKVYYSALGIVITTYQKIVLKWYERPEFAAFLQILSMVLLVVSFGTSIKASLALQGTASALTIASTVLVVILKFVLTGLIIDYTVKIIIKEVGAETGAALALLAMAYGLGRMATLRSITDQSANALLALGSTASKHTINEIQEEISDIIKGTARLKEEYETTLEKIEDKREELGLIHEVLLDPSIIMDRSAVLMDPYESVDLWLSRGIHTGNIGTLILDYPKNFATLMLQLPKYDHEA